jgi:branched-chain amino acid transport system permease protein
MSIIGLRSRPSLMHVRYEEDLRLFPARRILWMVVLLVAIIAVPYQLSGAWLNVLDYAAVFAVGAIGLNLLTGYTGQISLGHAFFMGIGAYVAAEFGVKHDLPLLVYLPLAAVIGALVGGLIGPFALRLRGDYLAIITLGLVFTGQYVFDQWSSVTGGGAGVGTAAPLEIGPWDFGNLHVFGRQFTREQGLFWLFTLIVAIAALLAKNVVRSRPGRAMQAVRDRDLAAEVVGVSQFRYKVGAFAISSGFGAVAGAMYASLQQFVSPSEWSLLLSIQFVAIIIIGGMGTIFGSILGALVVRATPELIKRYSNHIPGVIPANGGDGVITAASLNNLLYGVLIVLFLVLQPQGLAALWLRIKGYFKAWPFSS